MSESALRLARKLPSMKVLTIETDVKCVSSNGRGSSCKTPCMHRKVKSAVSLCIGILFCTVVLFVLVSLDPAKVSEDPRLLVTFPYKIRSHALLAKGTELGHGAIAAADEVWNDGEDSPALEGMGILFRKGKRAMPALVVAHLSETTTVEDLRLFLRGLHRSGMPARADVVLLFPWRPVPIEFANVIRHEEKYFRRLMAKFQKAREGGDSVAKLSVFNPVAYTRAPSDFGKGRQESVWGAMDDNGDGDVDSDEKVHFGAIVGFDMQELDPDDTLSGFLDSSPANLRRWVCYQILLGMVRDRYRHVFLTEVTGVFILKDVLAPLKKKDTSLHLYYTGQRWRDPESPHRESPSAIPLAAPESHNDNTVGVMESVYGKSFWNSLEEEDKKREVVSTSVIMGGIRQVRSVAAAMATEIVRVALLRKNKGAFRVDSPFLSFLVHKSSVLGKKVASHLQVHESGASTVNLLPGPPRAGAFDDFFRTSDRRFAVLQGLQHAGVPEGRRAKIMESLRMDICSSQNDLEIYSDCYSMMTRSLTDQTDSKMVF